MQDDKDNRGSTKDLTEYKGGSTEGLRGMYQNNVAQNTEITGMTTADNIYQSFTMEGATLATAGLTETQLNWLHCVFCSLGELFEFQSNSAPKNLGIYFPNT